MIRARYPVLYVVSWEESRVEQHLLQIANRRNKQLYVWSITGGMRKLGAAANVPRARGMSDPIEALDQIIENKEPAIYLLPDFHAFLRQAIPCNAPNIRKLRETARALSDSYKTVVICSPHVELPPELEKDVTVCDFPLPGPPDVDGLLTRICKDVGESSALQVNLDDSGREALIRAASGLTLQEAENVFAKTLVNDGRLDGKDVSTVFAEKQQIVRKSGLLEYYEATSELSAVGGLGELKDWLRRRSLAFSQKAHDFGLPAPKGVLLVGVQGCGKSLCAKAVSREWNMPLLRFDVGRVFSSLVGSSESNVRRAIAVAESIAPAVLWVDEIDKAFAGSQGSGGSDGGTSARVMSTLLTWLSEKQKPVFVLATANDISHLPPELLRKGRLDEIFFVDLPTASEREEILRIHFARRKREVSAFDLPALSSAADGFSGAEIEQAVISALYDAFYVGRDLQTADVLKSIRETVPLSRTMSERVSDLRAWAEGRARFASKPDGALVAAPKRKLEV
ncbi:MAG TPA: AAA family ATPase [Candidatus Bathyarchaeia archaeon]|nr:AAA family ATPase [Candidatus Bathyarchaeia archaeon]